MTNINPNDDVGKINHIIKKEDKVNKKEKPVAETKQVEASSLDALNSYGKASITFRGVKPKQETVTKEQVLQRLNEVDIPENIKEDIRNNIYTPERILLANKFLLEPKLYENENLQQKIGYIIYNTWSEERFKILDKFLSNPKLYENENLQQKIGDIIDDTWDEEEANARINIIDKYLSNPKLYENENLQQNIGDIICKTNTEEKANARINIIDKYLSNPKLYENENLQQNIGDIIDNTWGEEEANARINIIDKYLSAPKLNENENLQQKIGDIIDNTWGEEEANVRINIIDKYLSSPKLYQNEEICDNIGEFIAIIDTVEKSEYASTKLFDEIINNEMSVQRAVALIKTYGQIDPKKIKQLERTVSSEAFKEISKSTNDLILAANLVGLYNKNNINEIPLVQKRDVLREIVKNNINLFDVSDVVKENFPLIPKSTEEYCALLPNLVKSLGIETNEISTEQEQEFDNATKVLSNSLSQISDEEFVNLSITQEYSKDEFIQDVFNLVKDMKKDERQKVYDYFGFELHHNKNGTAVNDKGTKFSIAGYPVNLNNGKKLAQIDNEQTKQIIEQLRPYVIKFSENNKISCDNKEIETALNEIAKVLPEIKTFIGKTQHETQHFDIMKHSLKVMQKVVQNPKFNEQSDSDKKILLLASLLHDSAKSEGNIDPIHAHESSFDAFYISQKFNLTKDERIKLYSLIDNHEWLADINKAQGEKREKQLKSKAFDLQYDNLFELSKIFTEADLKAVKIDDRFFDKFKDDFNVVSEQVQSLISTLKTSQPLLPVTKLPTSSKIKEAITIVNDDYSTNLKGVYVDEKGMVIIKYNEVENNTWEKIGFPKGSFSKGIEHTVKVFDHKDRRTNKPVFKDEDINTGNIHFFVHGLDEEKDLSNFDAFELPDADALLSVSYAERPESKYRFFRSQGVILNADTKYVHGGGETDSGSGCGKNIDEFKTNYAYEGSIRHTDRTFVSDLIKEDLGLSTQEYLELINKYKNKPFSDIEPKELQEKIIKALSKINSHVRNGKRSYNEMYISNPNVMGYFAYDCDDKVGEIKDFINNDKKVLPFIKQNAVENDMPLIVFGD